MKSLSRFVIVLSLQHFSTQGFAQGRLIPPGALGNDVGPIGSATNNVSPWANISF